MVLAKRTGPGPGYPFFAHLGLLHRAPTGYVLPGRRPTKAVQVVLFQGDVTGIFGLDGNQLMNGGLKSGMVQRRIFQQELTEFFKQKILLDPLPHPLQ